MIGVITDAAIPTVAFRVSRPVFSRHGSDKLIDLSLLFHEKPIFCYYHDPTSSFEGL
jgi:hypothetical protein